MPKDSWNAIKTLTKGETSYYNDTILMKFKMKNSNFSTSNKETIIVLTEHFYHVYNRQISVDWKYLYNITPNKIMYEISGPMNLDELNIAIRKLAWHKALGRNRVSPNAIKALNKENRIILL